MNNPSLTVTHLRKHDLRQEFAGDSTIFLRSGYELEDYPEKTGVWLHQWADLTPDAVFLAEKQNEQWRELTYREALNQVRAVASGLLVNGMKAGEVIVIMSGNSVDHGILTLAAQYVGIITVPLAEQYSLIADAHDRLKYIVEKVKPVAAYVADSKQFEAALSLSCLDSVTVISSGTHETEENHGQLNFANLSATEIVDELENAYQNVTADTPAKILFTSGSTSLPKGVVTTQRMLCVNQVQLAQALPFLKDRAPRILDWLPWNHVFGGNHNFNMMLASGGSLRIDSGRPVGSAFNQSINNIYDHAGTLAFNVPLGFAMLVEAMFEDQRLKKAFFEDLDMIFYAGASLPAAVWSKLEEYALEIRGKLPLMISSWGLTETAPANLIVHQPCHRSGVIGVPMPGITIKLIQNDDVRYEVRVKGPNVMPGYFEDQVKTAESFDQDGFLITGDAVRFADPSNVNLGLAFDGRISEDFKLQSGTWVQASVLRLKVLEHLGEIAQDVVVCGEGRAEIGLLIFPTIGAMEGATTDNGALIGRNIQMEIQDRLTSMAKQSTGSSTRVCRALVASTPPSLQTHEITVKGNLNVRKVLDNRSDLVERLYNDSDPATSLLKK